MPPGALAARPADGGGRVNSEDARPSCPRTGEASGMRISPRRLGVTARRRAGLTLLEVVCVIAITGVMMGALLGAVTMTARGVTDLRRTMRSQRLVTGIERLLRHDLSSACAVREPKLPSFIGRPAPSLSGEPVLEFFTTRTLSDRPEGAIQRVSYTLRRSEDDEETYDLFRRESAYAPGKKVSAAPEERLASGIALFDAQFHDGTLWREQWERNALPDSVRVVLTLRDRVGEEDEAVLSFSFLCDRNTDPLPSP